jgi:membrane protease YdiL (CAAX protease family)
MPASRPEPADLVSQRFIVVALVYPVLEEIVFRGVLQGWLLKQGWGPRKWGGLSSANLVTSFVFMALHVARRPGILSVGVFVPSLVFGFFRERYGNLYVPIALHIFYNAGIVLYFA